MYGKGKKMTKRRKKRGVAYVRVSTDQKSQVHSFEFQERYWREQFEENTNVAFVTIYADRGISGSSVHKRPQFLAMMRDARAGKFDVIYTKSVSRFGRNTVQLLEAVRELRELGIEVIFEKEQISTLASTSELFMTIAATIAENDLQMNSDRMKWSIARRYEEGWISIGSGMYGYEMTEDNQLEIVPHEAEVVRRIYDMYISGMGCTTIAKKLNEEGIRNWLGNEWRPNGILDIIDNEKYMGDALMGKWVMVDGVQHENRDGRYGKRYYMEDTHEGIVSKETYHKAQAIRKAQSNEKKLGQPLPVYDFTGKIECGQCGTHYRHKIGNSGQKWQSPIWACGKYLQRGVTACDCTRIKDSILREKFVEAYNEFVMYRPVGSSVAEIQRIIDNLYAEEAELAQLMINGLLSDRTFRKEQAALKAAIEDQRDRLRAMRNNDVKEADFRCITEFDPEKARKFITKVIVTKNVVTFVFYNEARISSEYTNGKAGHKPGWNLKGA